MFKKFFAAALLVSLVSSCGNDVAEIPPEKEASNTTVSVVKEPALFPFGMNESNLKLIGQRHHCTGDCCSEYYLHESEEKSIYTYLLDCSEYSSKEVRYYFEGSELIAVHEKTKTMNSDVRMRKPSYIRQEKTMHFRDKLTYFRSDTMTKNSKDWITAPFEEIEFKDLSNSYLKRMVDLRTPVSYTPKSKIVVYSDVKSQGQRRKIRIGDPFGDKEFVIATGMAYAPIEDFESNKIPKDAKFAFSTWFAGGGEMYYGTVVNGVLKIFQRIDDEMLPMQPFNLHRVIDPEVRATDPAYYLILKENKGRSKNLMLACTASGEVIYVKYQGQDRQIELEKKKDLSKGSTIEIEYDEILLGVPKGKYVVTHQGNYDYVTYKSRSGETFKFTVDLDKSLVNGEYRTTPAF